MVERPVNGRVLLAGNPTDEVGGAKRRGASAYGFQARRSRSVIAHWRSQRLLGVELDDQLLGDLRIDLRRIGSEDRHQIQRKHRLAASKHRCRLTRIDMGCLRGLHERLHAGRYRARPSRRVYIPKADGRLRPLSIAALEDKILQRAVVEVRGAIYEADFRGFSYGFRPGRGPHDALDALTVGLERKKVNWVLDADIRTFFGQLDRVWLRRFLEHRIADPFSNIRGSIRES
jgi:hypothetical protein